MQSLYLWHIPTAHIRCRQLRLVILQAFIEFSSFIEDGGEQKNSIPLLEVLKHQFGAIGNTQVSARLEMSLSVSQKICGITQVREHEAEGKSTDWVINEGLPNLTFSRHLNTEKQGHAFQKKKEPVPRLQTGWRLSNVCSSRVHHVCEHHTLRNSMSNSRQH